MRGEPTTRCVSAMALAEVAMADAIEGVATAFPAFIGYTQKAETVGEPVWVASLAQYRAAFGGGGPAGFRLDAAIQAFYANGGDDAFVLSVGRYDAAGDPDPVPLLDGLERIGRETGPTLLLVPDAHRLTRSDYHVVVRAMLAQCVALGDRFAILDLHGGDAPAGWSAAGSAPLVADFRAAVAEAPGRGYAAAWHPWLVAPDGSVQPPAAAIAGLYARTDREEGVWKAPANAGLAGASDVAFRYRQQELAALAPPAGAVAVNAIRFFNELGLRVWGNRTLEGDGSDRYVPVRRTLIWLRQSLRQIVMPLLFQPRTPATMIEGRRLAEEFMTGLWRRGAFQGATSGDAFYVRIDDTGMTQDDLDNGGLLIEVGVALLRPAEFIHLVFRTD